MAQDWIKIEKCTPTKPEMFLLAKIWNTTPSQAFVNCFQFWAWVDDNLTDQFLSGISKQNLDDHIMKIPGFTDALITVGWLRETRHQNVTILSLQNYEKHLSRNAKNRSKNAKKQLNYRRNHNQ